MLIKKSKRTEYTKSVNVPILSLRLVLDNYGSSIATDEINAAGSDFLIQIPQALFDDVHLHIAGLLVEYNVPEKKSIFAFNRLRTGPVVPSGP